MKKIDLTGKRFGRLLVLSEAGRDKWQKILWKCKCDCGKETIAYSYDLKSGHTKSCGCVRAKKASIRFKNFKWTEQKRQKMSMILLGQNKDTWCGFTVTKNAKIRQTKEYNKWRKVVYNRDYWTCQECGIHCKLKNIVAHHIKSFADYPRLRFDINNGTTLCRSCHLKLHNKLRDEKKCAQAA